MLAADDKYRVPAKKDTPVSVSGVSSAAGMPKMPPHMSTGFSINSDYCRIALPRQVTGSVILPTAEVHQCLVQQVRKNIFIEYYCSATF